MPHRNPRFARRPGFPALTRGFAGVLAAIAAWPGAAEGQVRSPIPRDSVTGTAHALYRWKHADGSEPLYRSIVDLGEGPKLEDLHIRFSDLGPGLSRMTDSADLRMTSWGGEPSSGLVLDVGKDGVYDSTVRYRRFQYFNQIRTFANPAANFAGPSQQWADVERGLFDLEVDVRKRSDIRPFIRWSRDVGEGTEHQNFVETANEYTVATRSKFRTSTVAGGARLRFSGWTATLEAGGSVFSDDGTAAFSGQSSGNRTAPVFGNSLRLRNLDRNVSVEGRDRFARAQLEIRPLPGLTAYGRFAFSQPSIEARSAESAEGTFVDFATVTFFPGLATSTASFSDRPRPSGAVGVEYRPGSRVRIVQNIAFDRLHVSGNGVTERTFTGSLPGATVETGLKRIESRRTESTTRAVFSIDRRWTVDGAVTHVRADALSAGSALFDPGQRDLRRTTGRAGIGARPTESMEIRADFEIQRGREIFFRTDSQDVERLVLRWRYDVTGTVTATVFGSIWDHTGRSEDIGIDQDRHVYGADITWTPRLRWIDAVQASYERLSFSSDIGILVPQTLQPDVSRYRERGHTAALAVMTPVYGILEAYAGGTLFVTTDEDVHAGARTKPTRYYRTEAGFAFPIREGLHWTGGWGYVAYNDPSVLEEHFRTHLVTSGFRYDF